MPETGWQHSRGIDGRNPLDWVATFPWITWQHSGGLGGRNPWNTHTDVMVDFFKHKDPAKGLIEQLSRNTTLALSALTITELRSGWTSEQADFLLPRLYALCTVVPVTKAIAEQDGKWRQEYKSKGVSLV